jgi:glyoxylase-like metal-dependent hydrolase (beta-lactamase superfamily II)
MPSQLGLQQLTFNPLYENTYIVFDIVTKEAVIIDPGCYTSEEVSKLSGFISENNLKVKLLLNTHGHVDHVLGNYFVKKTYNVPFLVHEKDLETLRAVQVYAPSYGFNGYQPIEPDQFIKEGDSIPVGNLKFDVRFVPGHAPGHIAFILKEENICISGDVLFKNSVGRTDLPGANFETLKKSIHEQLFTLPDSMKVYPGHGPFTSIGDEKKFNPYCSVTNK